MSESEYHPLLILISLIMVIVVIAMAFVLWISDPVRAGSADAINAQKTADAEWSTRAGIQMATTDAYIATEEAYRRLPKTIYNDEQTGIRVVRVPDPYNPTDKCVYICTQYNIAIPCQTNWTGAK